MNLLYAYSQVFPGQTSAKRPISKDSVLAKLKEKRAALKLRSNVSAWFKIIINNIIPNIVRNT